MVLVMKRVNVSRLIAAVENAVPVLNLLKLLLRILDNLYFFVSISSDAARACQEIQVISRFLSRVSRKAKNKQETSGGLKIPV